MKIMQSTVERLLYVLLFMMLALGIFFVVRVQQIGKQLDNRTEAIQRQMSCIGSYFTKENRQNIRIKSLDQCSIIKSD